MQEAKVLLLIQEYITSVAGKAIVYNFTFSCCFSSAQDLNSFLSSFSYFRAWLFGMNVLSWKYCSGESFCKRTFNNHTQIALASVMFRHGCLSRVLSSILCFAAELGLTAMFSWFVTSIKA